MTAPSLRGRALLAALYADLPGVLELRAVAREDGIVGQAFVDAADHRAIAAFMRRHAEDHVYFGVALRRDDTSGALANCGPLPALFADLDFKQYPGGEDEARAAIARCPFPATAVVASGGGLHAYWRLKEPWVLTADADAAKRLLRRLATSLGADLAAAEPARVLRLPNTVNGKYDPPRRVRLELLEADREYNPSDFDEVLPADPGPATTVIPSLVKGLIPQGQRHQTLARLAGTMRRRGMSPEAIEAALLADNLHRTATPLPDAEVRRLAHDIGKKPPVDEPGPSNGTATGRMIRLTAADQIAVRPVQWVWQDRLASGTLALLGGREGLGKSTVSAQLVADLTRGRLRGRHAGTPRAVIVAATEDSRAHTIVPRLMAAGADLSLVHFADVITEDGVCGALSFPRDLAELERVAREVQAALILLDPLLSRLDAALDSHKDAEVRLALEPLVTLADTTGASVLGLIHVNKSTTADPLTMLMGSRAFAAVARAVLFVMADPEDDTKRLLGQPKNNLGKCDLSTLSFRLTGARVADTPEGEVWTSQVVWLGESQQTIREAIDVATASSGERTATAEAAAWLTDYLTSQGGTAESATIKTAGRHAGHTVTALHKARVTLHLRTDDIGFPRRTFWTLQSMPLQSLYVPGETTTTGTTGTTAANSPFPVVPGVPVVAVVPVVADPPREATTESLPSWVTDAAPADTSDPIGAHDEAAEPYVFEVEP